MKIVLTLEVTETIFDAIYELLPENYELTSNGNIALTTNTRPARFPDLLRSAMIDLCLLSNEVKTVNEKE